MCVLKFIYASVYKSLHTIKSVTQSVLTHFAFARLFEFNIPQTHHVITLIHMSGKNINELFCLKKIHAVQTTFQTVLKLFKGPVGRFMSFMVIYNRFPHPLFPHSTSQLLILYSYCMFGSISQNLPRNVKGSFSSQNGKERSNTICIKNIIPRIIMFYVFIFAFVTLSFKSEKHENIDIEQQ